MAPINTVKFQGQLIESQLVIPKSGHVDQVDVKEFP